MIRMPEQENIWEYYNVLIQRLRLHVDAPFTAGPDKGGHWNVVEPLRATTNNIQNP